MPNRLHQLLLKLAVWYDETAAERRTKRSQAKVKDAIESRKRAERLAGYKAVHLRR